MNSELHPYEIVPIQFLFKFHVCNFSFQGEAQLTLLRKEIEDNESKCTAEIETLKNDIEKRAHELDIMEQEAEKFLKVLYCAVSIFLSFSLAAHN